MDETYYIYCAAYSLSERGEEKCSVTLIDAGHPFKSSWGETRIARLSQPEGPLKLAMMQRARTFAVVLTVSLAFTHYCLRSLTFVLKKYCWCLQLRLQAHFGPSYQRTREKCC